MLRMVCSACSWNRGSKVLQLRFLLVLYHLSFNEPKGEETYFFFKLGNPQLLSKLLPLGLRRVSFLHSAPLAQYCLLSPKAKQLLHIFLEMPRPHFWSPDDFLLVTASVCVFVSFQDLFFFI